jgi:hypothetical protein
MPVPGPTSATVFVQTAEQLAVGAQEPVQGGRRASRVALGQRDTGEVARTGPHADPGTTATRPQGSPIKRTSIQTGRLVNSMVGQFLPSLPETITPHAVTGGKAILAAWEFLHRIERIATDARGRRCVSSRRPGGGW